MKNFNLFLFSLSFILATSCNNENTEYQSLIPENCVVPQEFLIDTKTVDFKSDVNLEYTVQVPVKYTGNGILPNAEGFTFLLYDKEENINSISDYNIYMFYDYCKLTTCPFYGRILDNYIPDFVPFSKNYNIILNQKIEVCNALDTYGYFYHSEGQEYQGKLFIGEYFMNINGEFVESVSFIYKKEKLKEVLNIIKSIKRIK